MTNTNARIVREFQADHSQQFSDLPNPSDLELDGAVRSGEQQSQQRQANQQRQREDREPLEERLNKLEKMLKDKEAMIGRQANEIGHLRDLSDQLLRSQTSAAAATAHSQSQEPEVQVSSDEILERPVDAIRKVVSPLLDKAVQEIRGDLSTVKGKSAEREFAERHPTYQQDMQNAEFQEFVRGSRYRTALAQKAHHNGDFDAADELWTAWEERQATATGKADDGGNDDEDLEQEARRQHEAAQRALRDASTVRGGGTGGGGAAKPVYSARKLQDMRNNDPDGYYSPGFQKLILEAYREGRVK